MVLGPRVCLLPRIPCVTARSLRVSDCDSACVSGAQAAAPASVVVRATCLIPADAAVRLGWGVGVHVSRCLVQTAVTLPGCVCNLHVIPSVASSVIIR